MRNFRYLVLVSALIGVALFGIGCGKLMDPLSTGNGTNRTVSLRHAESLTFSNTQYQEWVSEARNRSTENSTSARASSLSRAQSELQTSDSGLALLGPQATVYFLYSLDRLEARYPYASPNRAQAFPQVYSSIQNAPAHSTTPFSSRIKAAALRFLDRIQLQPSQDTSTSGLSMQQLIALTWYAINDSSIYRSETDYNQKIQDLMRAFAQIQRSHNNQSNAIWIDESSERLFNFDAHRRRNETSEVNWDDLHHPDQPSFPDPDQIADSHETEKRLIYVLHGSHPDVRFTGE